MKFKCTLLLLLVLAVVLPLNIHAQAAKSNAEKILSIDETIKELGAVLNWDPFSASGVFTRGENRLKFYSGRPGEQGMALFDGRDILAVSLPYIESGLLRFPETFVTAVKGSFLRPSTAISPGFSPAEGMHFRIAAVIIDPGHGGRDPGAIGTHRIGGRTVQVQEKDVALTVSKKLAELLGSAYPGKKILLTRTGDTTTSLEDRVYLANTVPLKDNEAIIYISIHANASKTNKNARGYEIWYLPPETHRELIDRKRFTDNTEIIPILNDMLQAEYLAESVSMGRNILNRFRETLGNRMPSRGLKAENWYVVLNARMPAILVELGFVSNAEDARLMTDESYLKLFAEALYKGIADFIIEFERSGR